MSGVKLCYDHEGDYLEIIFEDAAASMEEVSEDVFERRTPDGRVVGIAVFNLSKHNTLTLPLKVTVTPNEPERTLMDWEAIRELYPGRWLVAEALNAYTEGKQRIIPQLAVIETFADDWRPAWLLYKELHKADPNREYYFLHTDREELDIGVIDPFGRIMGE